MKEAKKSWDFLRTKFLEEVKERLHLLKESVGKEQEKKECKLDENKGLEVPKPELLADAPHIYFGLALMDEFKDNKEGGITILEKASGRFGDDRDYSHGILFDINFTLANYLYDNEYDSERIFPYLDTALEIAQETGRIDKWKRQTTNHLKLEQLLKAKERFEEHERAAKNNLAYLSAAVGEREFEGLLYAEQNYNDREKLYRWKRLSIIDTYGYVKMAFAARKIFPDFEQIEQAKALFQEALSHIKGLPERNRRYRVLKGKAKRMVQSHLEQADRLLASR